MGVLVKVKMESYARLIGFFEKCVSRSCSMRTSRIVVVSKLESVSG